jgi:hypothetical protein
VKEEVKESFAALDEETTKETKEVVEERVKELVGGGVGVDSSESSEESEVEVSSVDLSWTERDRLWKWSKAVFWKWQDPLEAKILLILPVKHELREAWMYEKMGVEKEGILVRNLKRKVWKRKMRMDLVTNASTNFSGMYLNSQNMYWTVNMKCSLKDITELDGEEMYIYFTLESKG